MHSCFVPAKILLPGPQMPVEQWACLACDQFTSQPAYWAEAERQVQGLESTLHLVLPEVYLEAQDEPARIEAIHEAMRRYRGEVLTRKVNGFIYLERTLQSGAVRQGLVGCIDLEDYDYAPGSTPLVRPTERTVPERIPPRLAVRRGAALETPHIMMLADDAQDALIGPVAAQKARLPLLYAGETPLGGGFLQGWAVVDETLVKGIVAAMADFGSQTAFDARWPAAAGQPPLALAVGDGNHSLATAKAYWEELKPTLPPARRAGHPARYCLAEVCNVYSPAIEMEAIHRVVFGVPGASLLLAAAEFCDREGIAMVTARPQHTYRILTGKKQLTLHVRDAKSPLAIAALDRFLTEYAAGHQECRVDYIHGEETVRQLAAQGGIGILLPEFKKSDLFTGVVRGGVLPKKTFGMGMAREKRCYFECRALEEEAQ